MSPFKSDVSVPIVPMAVETSAKRFCLEYLGSEIDWEHRFGETSPLYMQVRQGGSVLHLDGHAGAEAPRGRCA